MSDPNDIIVTIIMVKQWAAARAAAATAAETRAKDAAREDDAHPPSSPSPSLSTTTSPTTTPAPPSSTSNTTTITPTERALTTRNYVLLHSAPILRLPMQHHHHWRSCALRQSHPDWRSLYASAERARAATHRNLRAVRVGSGREEDQDHRESGRDDHGDDS